MISAEYLQEQLQASRRDRKSSLFLRRFVFRVVDQILRDLYGENYSIRCLQSSIAIYELLASLGVRSHIFGGAVCLSRATVGYPYELSWAGFWDKDHHAWVATEWHEFADLTIGQLHLHPVTKTNDEPIPPIWWHPADVMPPIIKYLPAGIVEPSEAPLEAGDYERIKSTLQQAQADVMESCQPDRSLFGTILFGPSYLDDLTKLNHPWAVKSLEIQDLGVPFPDWIVAREQQLMGEWQNRR